MVMCTNDDLAKCCGVCNFKVIACIPVFGRLPLLKHTIERLLNKNKVWKVICAGSSNEERKVVEAAGGIWIQYRNRPLGNKWNAIFQEASKYSPDACLFVGSSDWISDNWLRVMRPYMDKYDILGTAGCHFLHISNPNLLCYWPGYIGRRKGESIGIGRLISSKLLTQMQWQPFNGMLDRSLDYSMMEKCRQLAGKSHLVSSTQITSVSISTDLWPNKHNFFDHYHGKLPSKIMNNTEEWIAHHYPEAKLIFKNENTNPKNTITSTSEQLHRM